MTASSRGSRAAASLIRSSRPRVCSSCLQTLTRNALPSTRRTYAAAAPVLKTLDGPDVDDMRVRNLPPIAPSKSQYKTHSGLLLSRPPLLTRPLTPFEKSFFFYQKRLNERLVMPFSRYFYFKKDTPADVDWKLKARERNGAPARELGGYNPYGEEGWNDELLVGDQRSETREVMESLLRDSEVRAVEGKDGKPLEVKGEQKVVHEGGKAEGLLGRLTESDLKRDLRRLDRKLGRTLYLVVKGEGKGWMFPEGEVEGRENLLQAAERILTQSAGQDMNTWIIGHAPVGHRVVLPEYTKEDSAPTKAGTKTFFMKARIMAGQANLKGNPFGLSDYKWLTKEEVQKHVSDHYFSWVKNMMADR